MSPEASIPLISMIFVCYSKLFWVIQIPTSKMPNFFVHVRLDLVYASGWPLRPVRPILKVKRVSKWAYPSFWRFLCAMANHFLGHPDSDVKNTKLFFGRPSRGFSMHPVGLTARPTHFDSQTSPVASIPLNSTIFVGYSKPFFGWSGFRRHKCQIFLSTSVKTLSIHRLAFTVRLTHFGGQPIPEASIPLISMIFMFYSKPFFEWSGFQRQKCQILLWMSVKNFSMHPVGPHGSSDQFWRSNEFRS